jgi:hypothetical protein
VIERTRPIKQFRAVVAFGPYSKGAKMQPTGIYRDTLLRKGFIEEVRDEPEELENKEIQPATISRRELFGASAKGRR